MRRRVLRVLIAISALGVIVGGATSAHAFPGLTQPCNNPGCHTGGGVTVASTQVSNNGAQAVFNVQVSGGASGGTLAWAVFQGTTRVAGASGATGQYTVNVGQTYTVFGVSGPNIDSGIGQMQVSPVGGGGNGGTTGTVDTTPPVTRSDVRATYFGTATIDFTATDQTGGVRTFYVLDCGAQVESGSLVVTETGPHFLQFWSVDATGNVESPRNRAIFTVLPAPAFTMSRPVVTPSTVAVRRRFTISGSISATLPVTTTVTIRIYRRVNTVYRLFRTHTAALPADDRTWSIRPTQPLPNRGAYRIDASIRFNNRTVTAPSRFFNVR